MKISDSAFSQKGDFDALGYGLAILYGIIVTLSLFIG